MDFFAHLFDSWLWFVYFCFTSKETTQNLATALINIKIIHSFLVLRGFVIREKRQYLRVDWEKMYAIHLKLE